MWRRRVSNIRAVWARAAFAVFAVLVIATPLEAAMPRGQPTASPTGLFEFHIDPWVSLHHFAFQLSSDAAKDRISRRRAAIRAVDQRMMSPSFQKALDAAFKAYEPYINKDLLFDDDLRAVAHELAEGGADAVADKALGAALKDLMPYYLSDFWPAHQARAQALLFELTPQLNAHEAFLRHSLAEEIGGAWSDESIRVDITAYANWAGAYTVMEPNEITISATDEVIADGYALEILFHEALHTAPIGRDLRRVVNEALADAGVEDGFFWHLVLCLRRSNA